MKLTKSITVKTFALMAAAVFTVSSPLAVFAADQTSMNDQATEAAQKFYRAALEAGNDEDTAMKIAQDAVIKTKKAIVQKKAEDISDGTVSDELTEEEKQILDEVMKEDTAQDAAAASTESSETSAASTQSGADLQAQAESQSDAALYLSQAAAQAKDLQDTAATAGTEAASAASTEAAAAAGTEAATAASTEAAPAAGTDAATAVSTEATTSAGTEAAPAASTEAAATATETAAAQAQTQQQIPAASYQAAQALQALQQVQLQQAQAAAQAAQAAAQTNTAASASDRELLAAIIYCEAGNQSHTGKVAVGNVVMNRVNSSKFPNSISSVVYQRGQFSPAGSGWLNRVLRRGTIPADCYAAADEALAGSKPVGGSVFFMRRELHSSGTIIGAHCFWGMM
ncbi:MAG: cell wall hydrolase [Firmicutes bacterium]|nr:cell wall hydrolase [Bacillota bacterium]